VGVGVGVRQGSIRCIEWEDGRNSGARGPWALQEAAARYHLHNVKRGKVEKRDECCAYGAVKEGRETSAADGKALLCRGPGDPGD
jgi:hypothetical protein